MRQARYFLGSGYNSCNRCLMIWGKKLFVSLILV